jgi:dihydrofolate synthase / folylpolyglutamate synthase
LFVTPLDFLFSLERLGMKFGLESMRTICRALDHPERSFRSAIVAGTNGKGSVTAMTSAGLSAAGVKSARYTSPHLERLEERFVIDEREVETAALESAAATVQTAVERLVRDGELEALPTFFECTTAIAFELFRRAAVEMAVVEVGLGGRLDATNVITPVAAAITSIDFDHQDLLGNSLHEIAREKAGVITPGIPVVVGPMGDDADAVIRQVCVERGARYVRALDRVRIADAIVGDGTRVSLRSDRTQLTGVALALPGRHQIDNAAVAMCLMEELDVPANAIEDGLTHARWPGRLETVRWRGAEILIDAAHNPSGARALAEYLRAREWSDVTLLVGAMRDKDVTGILQVLAPFASTIVCTAPPNLRALAADALAALATRVASPRARIAAIPDPRHALEEACRTGGRVVVSGSIFLIGALRGILR